MKTTNVALSMACILSTSFPHTTLAGGPDRLYLGIGANFESSIYESIDDEVEAFPIINAQKGGFYWEGSDIGYRLYENRNIEIGPVFSLFEGYGFDEEDLGDGYKGLETRDDGQSYGLFLGFELEPFSFGIKPMKHSEDGSSIELSVEHEYRKGKLFLMSSLFVEHLDKDYTDNYFGVSQSEVNNPLNTRLSSTYKADSANNIGLEFGMFYELSEKWLLSGRMEYISLDSSITDSPLVEDDHLYSLSTGISYRF